MLRCIQLLIPSRTVTAMFKYCFMIYYLLIFTCNSNSAPTETNQNRNSPMNMLRAKDNPKMFWNFIGDIVSASGILPVEVNVPDTVGTIYGGAQTVYNGISTITSNIVQQIPLLNRLTSSEKPRLPLYALLFSSARSSSNMPQRNIFLYDINFKYRVKLDNAR